MSSMRLGLVYRMMKLCWKCLPPQRKSSSMGQRRLVHTAPVILVTRPQPATISEGNEACALGAPSYMPHLSLLYEDLSDEEKKKAQEKANVLDESIGNLSFEVTRLALYETNPEDKTLKSWKKIAECNLDAN
ncbi:hypothetical protein CsSME_00030222 [Camellia sinensis var. sinensis]